MLVALSILALHAFVYALDFRGEEKLAEAQSGWRGIIAFSIAGYGIALLVSLYVLWTFGRTDGADPLQIAMMVSVLGFPAALGASAAVVENNRRNYAIRRRGSAIRRPSRHRRWHSLCRYCC